MKILFICRANVGRSQVAEAFYNFLVSGNTAKSAGYAVNEKEGQSLHPFIIQGMKERGFDLTNNTRKQLTQTMLDENDMVVALFKKDEAPDWLARVLKVEYWYIADPSGKPMDDHRIMINEVNQRVNDFVRRIASNNN